MCQNWAKNLPGLNGIIIQYWTINPGGIYQVLYEPITGVDRFNVLAIQEFITISNFINGVHCTQVYLVAWSKIDNFIKIKHEQILIRYPLDP